GETMRLETHNIGGDRLDALGREGSRVRASRGEYGPIQLAVDLPAYSRMLGFSEPGSCICGDPPRHVFQQPVYLDLTGVDHVLGPLQRPDEVVAEKAVSVSSSFPRPLICGRCG